MSYFYLNTVNKECTQKLEKWQSVIKSINLTLAIIWVGMQHPLPRQVLWGYHWVTFTEQHKRKLQGPHDAPRNSHTNQNYKGPLASGPSQRQSETSLVHRSPVVLGSNCLSSLGWMSSKCLWNKGRGVPHDEMNSASHGWPHHKGVLNNQPRKAWPA